MSQINSFVEYAQALEDGEEEFQNLYEDEWLDLAFPRLVTVDGFENITVRVKPKAITIHEYVQNKEPDEFFFWHPDDNFSFGGARLTGRTMTGEVKDD